MAYSAKDKAQCDAIMHAFQPYLDRHSHKGRPYFDVMYSKKFETYLYVCDAIETDKMGISDATWLETPQQMLETFMNEVIDDVVFYEMVQASVEERKAGFMRIINEALGRMDDENRALCEPVVRVYVETEDFAKDIHNP